ncbi:unnamed protein product [Pieris brassicae]|uniref:Reverse transcriptase domain-containing protein n=1 Tax=Pieris brassicae TaxID=7116 RepID=A0A9P0XIY0_PIEBR|nr:unnamed protein product [Pieris brassicae]
MFIYDKSPIELEAYSETKNEFVELNTLNVNIDVDKELCDNLNKIRTGHMNEEEKREITRLCYRYRDIFHSENVPLTFTHAVKHQLRLSNDTPIYVRSYRQAPQQRAEIRNQVDNLLKQGIIRESISPWSCPVHIVPKKPDASGKVKWRLVIDLTDRTLSDLHTT